MSRVIAEFSDYAGMVAAMRSRAHDRRLVLTSDAIAAVAGLPSCYIAKLLSPRPMKRIGMISLGPLLAVLGCRLALIDDPQAIAALAGRIPLRKNLIVYDGAIKLQFTRQFMRKIGKKGAQKRWRGVRARHAAASKAAHIRWSK